MCHLFTEICEKMDSNWPQLHIFHDLNGIYHILISVGVYTILLTQCDSMLDALHVY